MKQVSGGVCAAKGFVAAGVHCGVKASSSPDKNDLALILSEKECTAAATYTLNRVKAAPLYVTMDHLENGVAWGVVANSGNANACCPMSHENAQAMCAGRRPGHRPGARGFCRGLHRRHRPDHQHRRHPGRACPRLAAKLGPEGSEDAARAIMTTDTVKKELAFSLTLGGKEVTLGAIAKGSGMIHPNMGTMLCFITTDCAITHEMLEDALREVVARTFNRVTVDGDTSTNDMCRGPGQRYGRQPPHRVEGRGLLRLPGRPGASSAASWPAPSPATARGPAKLVTCRMTGARSEESAERLAKAVVGSSLVKAAMFGSDANWGRVLCAMGYSKAPFRPEHVDVTFQSQAGADPGLPAGGRPAL